ncbi:hypothetical protein IKS57_03560, partial [bacterium]|nr:hypothetical protein [bacterium]
NPTGQGTINNRNHKIASLLDSLLSNIINVSNMSSYTAADALYEQKSDDLISNIKQAINTEIKDSGDSFAVDGIAYTASEIINKINISLPTSITVNDDENAQIPNVKLSYNGISLTANNSSDSTTDTFTIKGFAEVKSSSIGTNPTGKSQDNNRNHKIASLLDSILKQIITISGFTSTTAADALTNASSDNLVTAIISTIQTEISNNIKSFVIDGIAYSASEIANNLTVTLPKSITQKNDIDAQIPNVSLSYNSIILTAKTSSGSTTYTFTIEGFTNATASSIGTNPTGQGQDNNRNHKIASLLDSILNQIITVSGLGSITASDALQNALKEVNSKLQDAIISAIDNEIENQTFIIDGIAYTISQITSGLTISLPKSITYSDAQNGQIPNVQLSYNNILLTCTSQTTNTTTNSFIVQGFDIGTSASQIQDVAGKLGSLLGNTINISQFANMNGYTAAIALNFYKEKTNRVQYAIKSAISAMIQKNAPFIVNGIIYAAPDIINDLVIFLPSYISLINDEDAQIPNVHISYLECFLFQPQSNNATSTNINNSKL